MPALTKFLVILIIILNICAIIYYKGRPEKSKMELLWPNLILAMICSVSIGVTYYNYHRQGLTWNVYTQNAFKFGSFQKASNLAPKPNELTYAPDLNKMDKHDLDGKTIIVFKFGCGDCQALYRFAQKYKKLLPSDKVLWIPYTQKDSSYVKDAKRYPTVYQFKKEGNQLITTSFQEPTDEELQTILSNVK